MNFLKKIRSNLTFNIIGAIILLLVVFGFISSTIGFISFTNAFKREYAVSTYHMADTATTLINGDHLEAYLEGKETEEYLKTKGYLDTYCKKSPMKPIVLQKRTYRVKSSKISAVSKNFRALPNPSIRWKWT